MDKAGCVRIAKRHSRERGKAAPFEPRHDSCSCRVPAADEESRCKGLSAGELAGLPKIYRVCCYEPWQQPRCCALYATCHMKGLIHTKIAITGALLYA